MTNDFADSGAVTTYCKKGPVLYVRRTRPRARCTTCFIIQSDKCLMIPATVRPPCRLEEITQLLRQENMVSYNGGIPAPPTREKSVPGEHLPYLFSMQLRSDLLHLLLAPAFHLRRLAVPFEKWILSSSQLFSVSSGII